jgi:hypothetical protein
MCSHKKRTNNILGGHKNITFSLVHLGLQQIKLVAQEQNPWLLSFLPGRNNNNQHSSDLAKLYSSKLAVPHIFGTEFLGHLNYREYTTLASARYSI